MNAYEQMRNALLLEITTVFPEMEGDAADQIGKALDRAAYPFEVSVKETALAVCENLIPEIVKIYIAVKKTEGLSDATLSNYARTLKHFFIWVRKPVDQVVANDVRMFLYQYRQAHKISDRTLDKYRQMICWFFTWAYREEYIPKDPCKAVKSIKHEVKERQALTQLELERLRLACVTKRDKAILEFMYSTGCRVSELTTVEISDVNMKEGTVQLFGKGRKYRTSFINAKAEVALIEYLKERNDESSYLFVSERRPHGGLTKAGVEKIIHQISQRSDVKKHVTPHIIRHTTATQAVNNGMPIEDVSKLLGHVSVATTMIYAKVSNEIVQTQHMRCIV